MCFACRCVCFADFARFACIVACLCMCSLCVLCYSCTLCLCVLCVVAGVCVFCLRFACVRIARFLRCCALFRVGVVFLFVFQICVLSAFVCFLLLSIVALLLSCALVNDLVCSSFACVSCVFCALL